MSDSVPHPSIGTRARERDVAQATPRPVRMGKSDGARWSRGRRSGARGGQIAIPVQDDEQFIGQMPRRALKDADLTSRSPFGPVRSTGAVPVPGGVGGVVGVGTAGGATGDGVGPPPGVVPAPGSVPVGVSDR